MVANGDQRVEAGAHRRRQTLRHAVRQQGAGLVPGRPHRTTQHRVGRRENVFVPKPASRPRQQRRRAVEPQRFVFEEPRQPFADGEISLVEVSRSGRASTATSAGWWGQGKQLAADIRRRRGRCLMASRSSSRTGSGEARRSR